MASGLIGGRAVEGDAHVLGDEDADVGGAGEAKGSGLGGDVFGEVTRQGDRRGVPVGTLRGGCGHVADRLRNPGHPTVPVSHLQRYTAQATRAPAPWRCRPLPGPGGGLPRPLACNWSRRGLPLAPALSLGF